AWQKEGSEKSGQPQYFVSILTLSASSLYVCTEHGAPVFGHFPAHTRVSGAVTPPSSLRCTITWPSQASLGSAAFWGSPHAARESIKPRAAAIGTAREASMLPPSASATHNSIEIDNRQRSPRLLR